MRRAVAQSRVDLPAHRAPCHDWCMAQLLEESPLGRVVPRRAAAQVRKALSAACVVLASGARQSGKSTLAAGFSPARRVPGPRRAQGYSLDDDAVRRAAALDPARFLARARALAADDTVVIDEPQRVAGLPAAIARAVSADPRPGRFLLTGLAAAPGLRDLAAALAPHQMAAVEVWPLSQGELDGTPDGFVEEAFTAGPQLHHTSAEDRRGYLSRVIRGGLPAAAGRADSCPQQSQRFLDSYAADLAGRDVRALSQVQRGSDLSALIRLVAARSAQLIMPGRLGRDLGLPQATAARYLSLLEDICLIRRIPAWPRSLPGRQGPARPAVTPKVAMVDSGVAASLLPGGAAGLAAPGSTPGRLLEAFAAMEIARQLTWSRHRAALYHFRARNSPQVAIVLEDPQGKAVAIEVTDAATVGAGEFRGLSHLAQRLGHDLVVGVVLYTGRRTLAFGPRLRAVPISALWELGERR